MPRPREEICVGLSITNFALQPVRAYAYLPRALWALEPGGVWIAALLLLLGSIEAPHEARSQLARASGVTWEWLVISLLLVFRVRLADRVHA